MKNILIIFTLICITACKQTENKQENEEVKTDTLKTENTKVNLKFDDNNLNDIKKYCNKEFGKEDGRDTKFEDEANDSTFTRTYSHIPDDEESEDYRILSVYIPTKGEDGLIYGDLNNDDLQDLVVVVSLEGNGTGYGNSTEYFFVFLNQNNKLRLVSVADRYSLSHCDGGYFSAVKIENGYLVGTSYCNSSNDGSYPTIEYLTNIKLLKNRLVFSSQIKKK